MENARPEAPDPIDGVDPLAELEDDSDEWPIQRGGLGAIGQLLAALLGVMVLGMILLATAAVIGWFFQ